MSHSPSRGPNIKNTPPVVPTWSLNMALPNDKIVYMNAEDMERVGVYTVVRFEGEDFTVLTDGGDEITVPNSTIFSAREAFNSCAEQLDSSPVYGEVRAVRSELGLLLGENKAAHVDASIALDHNEHNVRAMLVQLQLAIQHGDDVTKDGTSFNLGLEDITVEHDIQMAEFHARQGNLLMAEKCLLKTHERNPGHIKLCCLYAEHLREDGRFKLARQVLETGLAENPGSVPLETMRAEMMVAGSERDEGLEHLHVLTEKHPGNTTVLIAYMRALSGTGRYQAACEEVNTALEKNPESLELLVALAEIAQENGDRINALECLNQAISCHPGKPDLYMRRHYLYDQMGDAKAAYDDVCMADSLDEDGDFDYVEYITAYCNNVDSSLRELWASHPRRAPADKELKDCYPGDDIVYFCDTNANGDVPIERCAIVTLVKIDPTSSTIVYQDEEYRVSNEYLLSGAEAVNKSAVLPDHEENFVSRMALAKSYYACGDFVLAGKTAETVHQQDPHNVKALTLLGLVATQLNDIDTATNFFEEAYGLRQDKETAWNLSDTYARGGNASGALEKCMECIDGEPKTIGEAMQIASIHSIVGQNIKAANALKKASDIDPQNTFYLDYQADMCITLGKYAQAVEYIEELLRINPSNMAKVDCYAMMLESCGEPYRYIELLEKQYEIDGHPVTFDNLSAAYRRHRGPQAYLEFLESAIESSPRSVKLKLLKAEHLLEMGSYEELLYFLEELITVYPDHKQVQRLWVLTHLATDQPNDAYNHAQASLERLSEDAALKELRRIAFAFGQIEQSYSDEVKTAERSREGSEYYKRRAELFREINLRPLALENLTQAAEREPADPLPILMQMARIQFPIEAARLTNEHLADSEAMDFIRNRLRYSYLQQGCQN